MEATENPRPLGNQTIEDMMQNTVQLVALSVVGEMAFPTHDQSGNPTGIVPLVLVVNDLCQFNWVECETWEYALDVATMFLDIDVAEMPEHRLTYNLLPSEKGDDHDRACREFIRNIYGIEPAA